MRAILVPQAIWSRAESLDPHCLHAAKELGIEIISFFMVFPVAKRREIVPNETKKQAPKEPVSVCNGESRGAAE